MSTEVSSHHIRASFAVRLAIQWLVKNHQRCTFLTLTFHDNITDKEEAARRWRNLKGRMLRQMGDLQAVGVWQRQKRGAWHLHLVVNAFVPIAWLRTHARACGWGTFCNAQAIGNTPGFRGRSVNDVSRYICRYVTREWGYLGYDDNHVRVVEYFGPDVRRATTSFRWSGGLSRLWRLGCGEWDKIMPANFPPRAWVDRDRDLVMRLGFNTLTPLEQEQLLSSSESVRLWFGLHPPDQWTKLV